MTDHPILRWRCTRCRVSGEVTCEIAEGVDARWNRVILDHFNCSPLCAEEYAEGGIAVDAAVGALPEAS